MYNHAPPPLKVTVFYAQYKLIRFQDMFTTITFQNNDTIFVHIVS